MTKVVIIGSSNAGKQAMLEILKRAKDIEVGFIPQLPTTETFEIKDIERPKIDKILIASKYTNEVEHKSKYHK